MKTVTEDIKINDTLNPDLWENNELKEEVKEKLLDIVDNFLDILKEDKINIDVVDVRFLGSNANYNYTDKSDIDLHIVADFSSTPCEQNVMPQLYNAYKSLFNSKYNISIYGHDVEIYVEDEKQPAKSNGVYSLYTGWIKEPNKSNIPNIDWEEFEKQFDEWEDRYFDVVGEHNSELEEGFWTTKKSKWVGLDGTPKEREYEIYKPENDNKYKRLCKKPINTLTEDEVIYIYAVRWTIYMAQIIPYQTPEEAIEDILKRKPDMKDDLKECYNFVHNLKFPLTIYRGIRVGEYKSSELNPKTNTLILSGKQQSRSWTTDINIYKNPTSKFRDLTKIVACEIDSNTIDVADTIKTFIAYSAGGEYRASYPENEITLKNNFKQSDLHNLRFINKDEIQEHLGSNVELEEGYGYKWKPNKAQAQEFAQKMKEISDFCRVNNIYQSSSGDSYYFELNGKNYRVSNHSVEASNQNSGGRWHKEGREKDTTYIHASKTRIMDIYNALKQGKKLDGRGNVINEKYVNNIDKDILDAINSPLDKLYKNTKCSKSVGTLLDKYFYEDDKPLKLCLGNIKSKEDKTNSKAITHVWIEVDGKVKETNFPDGDYERVLVDELLLDRNEDLYNQVEEFLNKDSLREDIDIKDYTYEQPISGSVFITQEGKFLKAPGNYHSDIRKFNEFKDLPSMFDEVDFCKNTGLIRVNDGTIREGEVYIMLPTAKLNEKQYKAVEMYLDFITFKPKDMFISINVLDCNAYCRYPINTIYDDNVDTDYIMKRIRQCATSHKLREDLQQEVDSEGNQLTPEQVKFFKNSKVRDGQGRLLVCRHSTDVDFDTFKHEYISDDNKLGYGFYFILDETKRYTVGGYEPKYRKACYLNITNPIYDDNVPEIVQTQWGISREDHTQKDIIDLTKKYFNCDGIISESRNTAVCFDSNQIKSIDNKNPSNSDNINEDYDYDKIYQIKELYKKAYDELIDNSTRLYRYKEWASNSNNDYKEYIYNDLKNNKKDSALNLWYNHYRLMTGNYDLSYEDFLNTPITLYRATNIKEDEDSNNPFFSYAQNKRGAERFLSQVQNLYGNRSGEIKEIQIKPKDTFGMIPSDENEIIVPNNSYQKRISNIENIVDELINYANTNNVELPYDKDELLDLFKKEGRNTNDFKNQIIKYVDKRKGKLKESKLKENNDYGYHAGDLGKSEGRQQQDGGRGTGHFGTGTYFVGNPDKIKGYNDYQYGKGKAPHHIVDFSSYNLYKPSNNDYGYKLHDTLKLLNNGYKYFTTHKDDLEWFKSHNISASKSGEFEGKNIPEIVEHLNNLIGDYDPIELPKDINWDTIDQEEDELWDKYYDELKPQYKDKGTGEFFDAIDDKVKENPKFVEYHSLIKIIREAIEEELDDRIFDRLNDYTNLVDKLYNALEGRHSKEEIQNALNEVNKNLYSKVGDSLSTIFMKALGYEGIDVRHLQDDGNWAGLDNTTYGSVIYDLKPDTIVENIDN